MGGVTGQWFLCLWTNAFTARCQPRHQANQVPPSPTESPRSGMHTYLAVPHWFQPFHTERVEGEFSLPEETFGHPSQPVEDKCGEERRCLPAGVHQRLPSGPHGVPAVAAWHCCSAASYSQWAVAAPIE